MTIKNWLLATLAVAGLSCSGCLKQGSPRIRSATSEEPITHPELVSLIGLPLHARPPASAGDIAKLRSNLADARKAASRQPGDPDVIIWVGRRLGYLWRVREAIDVYTGAIENHPEHAPLYRHRGHRYISLRRFDEAIADLELASQLIVDEPDEIELDGMPNAQNIPLTTTAFNIWYHLGVARYLTGEFAQAFEAFQEAFRFGREYDDNLVACTDWMYMSLRRLGRDGDAHKLLDGITPDMNIIENTAYHRRCLLYKGELTPDQLLDVDSADELDIATLGYGLGNWYLCNGETEKAIAVFKEVVSGPYWPAFGFVAAEVDLAGNDDALFDQR